MNESEASAETLKAVDMVNDFAARFVERLLTLKYVDTPEGQAAAMKQCEALSRSFVEDLDQLSESPACNNVHVRLAIAEARADIEHIAGDFAVLSRVTKYTADRYKGALKTNRDREDAAADLTDEIRQYYKRGMSAGDVRLAMKRGGEELPSVRTIQRHLKKNRP